MIYRLKTSVVEFAFKICSLISHRIPTSIRDCTSLLAGIRRNKTPNLRTNSHLREELRWNISDCKPHWKDNLNRQDRAELREIKNDNTVRVLPADKNLGPALMSTDWLKNYTLGHLYDELSYSRVTLEDWYVCRDNVIKRREQLMST